MAKSYVTKIVNSVLAETINKDLPVLGEVAAKVYAKSLSAAIPTLDKKYAHPTEVGNPFTKLVSTSVNRVPDLNEVMQIVIAAKACPQCGVVYATNVDGKVDRLSIKYCQMEICGLKE
jgi:hypothetical protein